MKKKKGSSAASASAVPAEELKAVIREHSLFFDELIELIPARFYLPTDEDDKPWFQGLSRAAKFAAKKQTRENRKKARRIRFDPEPKRNDDNADDVAVDKGADVAVDKDDDDVDKDDDDVAEDEVEVTYEELRQKLHDRIEGLKGNRGSESTSRKRKMENQRQRDLKEGRTTTKTEAAGEKSRLGHDTNEGRTKTETVGEKSRLVNQVEEAAKGVEFGKVKLAEDEDEKSKKRRKLSKGKMLEKAKEFEEAKRDPEKGGDVANKHLWKAVASRAAGEKVHDNPTRLKRSLHKEKKKKEKNAEKWKERVASRDKLKADKQQKRAGNIAERIQQTKTRKIAKREKKLMRPGFEGRKEGYINK